MKTAAYGHFDRELSNQAKENHEHLGSSLFLGGREYVTSVTQAHFSPCNAGVTEYVENC